MAKFVRLAAAIVAALSLVAAMDAAHAKAKKKIPIAYCGEFCALNEGMIGSNCHDLGYCKPNHILYQPGGRSLCYCICPNACSRK